MLLIVGLGNPGREYSGHRHNIGFRAVELIHARNRFGPWRARFRSETAEGTLAGRKVLLMKPSTFMNLSGEAVGEAARFFKVPPADIVAIHDELDLPAGKIRIKVGGGDGGHNGLRSLTQHLGADYRRLRIGIGHPGAKELVHGYVLHDFAKADEAWIEPVLATMADHADMLANDKDAALASKIHLALETARGGPAKAEKPKDQKDKRPASDSPSQAPESPREAARPTPRNDSINRPQDPPKDGPLARGLRSLFGKKDG